jgi:O-antigen/teichoic acid export membrane protein
VNIVGNWLLVPRYGAVGAAISTAFSYIVFFSMRTFISLKYYKVDYGLKKFYSVLVLIILYSFLHLINNSKVFLDFIGVIILCIGYIIYRKDIRIYKIFSK